LITVAAARIDETPEQANRQIRTIEVGCSGMRSRRWLNRATQRRWCGAICTALCAIAHVPVEAQAGDALAVNPAALRDTVRGAMGTQLAAGNLVGATLVIVHDGRVVLSEGFGYADLENRVPVEPDTTLFRIGSVAKLFVWIAVLQQAENGRLDLDADVNQYLTAFQVPQTYPGSITLRHLMTHTPGFEDRLLGLFVAGPSALGNLDVQLQRLLPRRLWAPGRHAAYSNYGAALAAHVVTAVTEDDWHRYVEQHIFMPLGMRHATTRQPVPEPLARHMAAGYVWRDGGYSRLPFEYVSLHPAGSASASAAEMGHFMNALLGAWPSTAVTPFVRDGLFAQGWHPHPQLNGMRHGIYERNSHGQVIIGHSGSTRSFHSDLLLYPEHRLGVFVAYNNDVAAVFRNVFIRTLHDFLFGDEPAASSPAASGLLTRADRYAGVYGSMRVPVSDVSRILGLLNTVRVRATPDGLLSLMGPSGLRRFQQVESGVFEERNGHERLGFREQDDAVTHMYFDSVPVIAFERLPAYRDPLIQLGFVAVTCILLASAVVLWPLTVLRRHRSQRGRFRASLIGWTVAAMLLGFVAAVATHLAQYQEMMTGLPLALERVLWVPVIAAPLALLQLHYALRSWIDGYWHFGRRMHFTLVTLFGVGLLFWLNYWQLMAIYL
jgi:CubicO group peptidase (beta-lactamase class C family)